MTEKSEHILVIDDDPSLRHMLSIVLKNEGYSVTAVDSAVAGLRALRKERMDLIISDIKMPDVNGIELLRKVKTIDKSIPVIMITGFASTNDAVEAMKLGAEDYVIKPFNLDELKLIIHKSLYRKTIEKENIELKTRLSERDAYENIIGKNPRMQKIFELIDTVAKTDSTVLISGESGTGKELIARAIHAKSGRSTDPFVSINCGALPENLLESELFGHVKGSFTDAYKDKVGLFEQANNGTLFLDEIGEMSTPMQVKLLRAIQERTIRRVGGNDEIGVDVRIISATNKDLAASMKNGAFRSDLYYRLNVISIDVPPLRERREDIQPLMYAFLQTYNRRLKKELKGFDKQVLDLFMAYEWPGNVRELENYVERTVALEKGAYVSIASLPQELVYTVTEQGPRDDSVKTGILEGTLDFNQYVDKVSKEIILKALEINNGNIKKSAQALNLSYRSLRYMIEKYGLKQRG